MDDPRHVVLAANRKNTGGELHHSLKIRVDAEQQQHHRHPRGAGDGADAEETPIVFKESLVRKLSRELVGVDGGAAKNSSSGGSGNYHQGVVRLRSREEGEGGSTSSSLVSLVERRKSQLESSGSMNQWNYADSFHSFRKDRVKVQFKGQSQGRI